MEVIGYYLIKIDTQEKVEEWVGKIGQCPATPDMIFLPDNIQVSNPLVYVNYNGFMLIPVNVIGDPDVG